MGDLREEKKFGELLKEKALRFTRERKELFHEVMKLSRHFDTEELFEIAKKRGLRVSRDTVFRTMPLLLECGVIQKSVGDGRKEYFERVGIKGHHDHMVCVQCGKIIEFVSEPIERFQTKLCDDYGFELLFHDHRLFGYCSLCAKKRTPRRQ